MTVRGENAAETVEGVGHRRDERAAMLGPGFTDEQSPQFVTDVVDRFTGPTHRNRVPRQAAGFDLTPQPGLGPSRHEGRERPRARSGERRCGLPGELGARGVTQLFAQGLDDAVERLTVQCRRRVERDVEQAQRTTRQVGGDVTTREAGSRHTPSV